MQWPIWTADVNLGKEFENFQRSTAVKNFEIRKTLPFGLNVDLNPANNRLAMKQTSMQEQSFKIFVGQSKQ
jgi:hypothetical protein